MVHAPAGQPLRGFDQSPDAGGRVCLIRFLSVETPSKIVTARKERKV